MIRILIADDHGMLLEREPDIEAMLMIADDGTGFEPGGPAGIGVLGMRERVDELGGEFARTAIRAKLSAELSSVEPSRSVGA